jgi:hypothetical protein
MDGRKPTNSQCWTIIAEIKSEVSHVQAPGFMKFRVELSILLGGEFKKQFRY